MRRTAVINQIHGLLLERGITLRKDRRYVDEAFPGIIADGTSKLSGTVLILLAKMKRRQAAGDSTRVMIDANHAYDPTAAIFDSATQMTPL